MEKALLAELKIKGKDMAKYHHRIFEMYEFRDEALRALTPRTNRAVSDAAVSESWTFTHLAVSNSASVTKYIPLKPRRASSNTPPWMTKCLLKIITEKKKTISEAQIDTFSADI